MREILFRAKHIHIFPENECLNGMWVYGFLEDNDYINSPELEGEFLVEPETVCQYTGLKDKKDRKIFEGDIVKHDMSDTVGTVKWYCEDYVGWCVDDIQIDDQQFTNEMWVECEVIGNIFDNPELVN